MQSLPSSSSVGGALEGIRVLDFTRFQQGPWGTVMLADMGAEVIKVEEPGGGDLGRSLGRQPDGFCAYFEAHDRNKKSVTVDLKSAEGREIILRMVRTADVLTHNFRPGVMERLGFGYEDIREVNPRIIYAAASGFGARGPLAHRPSFDSIGQGMSGIMVTQGGGGDADPQMTVPGVADQVGGMMFAYGIAVALIARERFGIGQKVDTSLYGSQIALQAYYITGNLRYGVHTPRRVNPTFTAYRCGDGKWLTIAILNPDLFPALCRAVCRPDLADDERFRTPFARADNAEVLAREFADAFAAGDRERWLEALVNHDIPCGPVQDHIDVGTDPQALENGYIQTIDHPNLGELRVVGPPADLSATPGRVGIAPELGQHTEEVLLELGYDWDDLEALRERQII